MRLRRGSPEPRMEMAPLIDVVFLLLTFFVFSMVLMVRVDLLGVRLPDVTAGEPATPAEVVSIGVQADGSVTLDGEPLAAGESIVERVRERLEAEPDATLYLIADTGAEFGGVVRLLDELRAAGFTEFNVVGRAPPAQ
ncbi:MAG: biopolymer transporter ExbD [Planctomycetota bacterium]